MNKKLKVLFIRQTKSSPFVEQDINILKQHYTVRIVDPVINRRRIWDTVKSVYSITTGVIWADLTYSWFAHLAILLTILLSKIFRKHSIVVIGGYEVAKVPEFNYGAMINKQAAIMVKLMLKYATIILAVSEFTKKEILQYTNNQNIRLVYNGIDFNRFTPGTIKEDIVLIVGPITKAQIDIHGLDVFINCASKLPTTRFIAIGVSEDALEYLVNSDIPSNVELLGFLPQQALIPYYQKAKVYCQLSFRESFGVSLAEAMLCECIPVVTKRGAMPEVVGNTGYYALFQDVDSTVQAIKKAKISNQGHKARDRVKRLFTVEKREESLINTIEEIVRHR